MADRGRKSKNADAEVYTTRIRTSRSVQRALKLYQARQLVTGGKTKRLEDITAEVLESWAVGILDATPAAE